MSGGHGPMRVYSALIGLYPRRFRDEYGADLVQLMRDQCADEPRWRVYSRAALDLAITIPAQQLETRMTRNPNHLVPLLYTALAVGGALFAMVGGTNATMLVVGLCMAVAAGAMAIVSWRRAAPISAAVTTSGWWKLVVAGPCLIAAVIIGAGIGVEAWFVGVATVLVAFVLTGTGLLLGLLRLTSRRPRTLSA